MESISLIGSIRQTLLSLQKTSDARALHERNLSNGSRVRQVADGAVQYFQAKALTSRITDLTGLRDSVNQGVGAIKAALDGAGAIDGLLRQMKAVAVSARSSGTVTEREDAARQFNELRDQVDALVKDASYNGLSLLSPGSSSLKVEFEGGGQFEVAAQDATSSGLGVSAAATNGTGFSSSVLSVSDAVIDTAIREIDLAISSLATIQQRLGGNIATLAVRDDFTASLSNTLREGAAKLTEADPFEEAASLLSSRTRLQLGLASLAIANQSGRSLLSLF